MGVQVTGGTLPGGVTPVCNECGVALCWDISEGEYAEDRAFWDAWRCRECNGGTPMRRADFRKRRSAATLETERFYTGVGSRETPKPVLEQMRSLAAALAQAGFTLRSGGAEGADTAFEQGARGVEGARMQIYLPWRGFNGNASPLYTVERRALDIARRTHPAWHRLSLAARKLHGRNCYQVLGLSLDTPSRFLVCWTSDGCESARTRSAKTGGTGTAIELAERHGVPVFNLGRAGRSDSLRELLQNLSVALPGSGIEERGQREFPLALPTSEVNHAKGIA